MLPAVTNLLYIHQYHFSWSGQGLPQPMWLLWGLVNPKILAPPPNPDRDGRSSPFRKTLVQLQTVRLCGLQIYPSKDYILWRGDIFLGGTWCKITVQKSYYIITANLELQIDLLLADPAFQSNTEQEWESGEWYREWTHGIGSRRNLCCKATMLFCFF